MTAKVSAGRRRAFLRALEVCGNVTVAAERACVSRSWVLLHRGRDGAFDADCAAAIEAAKARLGAVGTVAPGKSWGFLDGVELVVRGTGGGRFGAVASGGAAAPHPGRRTQIARARAHQWTPRIEARFLAVLGATCNVRAAYDAVGMSKGSAYTHRRRWPAFAARWDEALKEGYARIEHALVRNACNLFSSDEPPGEVPMPDMTAADAIAIVQMHRHQVHGIGRKPGRWRRPRTIEEVRASILRKLEAISRAGELDREALASWQRDVARRRAG